MIVHNIPSPGYLLDKGIFIERREKCYMERDSYSEELNEGTNQDHLLFITYSCLSEGPPPTRNPISTLPLFKDVLGGVC